jgi:hypothetical protein
MADSATDVRVVSVASGVGTAVTPIVLIIGKYFG